MSSGAYVYRPTYRDKINANLERLDIEETNLSKFFLESMREINSLKETIFLAKNISDNKEIIEQSVVINGIVYGETRNLESGLDLDNLVFAEVDTTSGEIVYMTLDYSEILSINNATNSSEFKKIKLASEINKSIMLLPINSSEIQVRITEFLGLLNRTLDDESVDYDYFNAFIIKRFEAIKKKCITDISVLETNEWKEYCALCLLMGETPKFSSDDDLNEQIFILKQKFLEKKYLESAQKTLKETLEELGLVIREEFSLEGIDGVLIDNEVENGYKFFLSEQNDTFIFELVEDEPVEASSKSQMCNKRRKIAEIMEQKGFPLDIIGESETSITSKAIQQKRSNRHKVMERTREKRSVAGKKPHAKMIGR